MKRSAGGLLFVSLLIPASGMTSSALPLQLTPRGLVFRPNLPARVASPVASAAAQVGFEQVVQELRSPDRNVRLRAARLLRDSAYPEAAVALSALLTDPDDEVQLEAIAAELNTFLLEPVVTRKHVGLVIEVRNRVEADAVFAKGALAIGARPVPPEVLTAMRRAARDQNPRVAVEALYAFGVLAVEPAGAGRRALLAEAAPELGSMIGASDPTYRFAAVRVIGRVYEARRGDGPAEAIVGDAMVGALNDKERAIRIAAMQALGSMRYARAVTALTEQFQFFGKGDLGEAALDALARIGHSASTVVFLPQLMSKNDTLKVSAIEGLARIGDRGVRQNVEAALGGATDDRVLLAGSFASVLLADRPLDPLAEALRRPKLADRAREYLTAVVPGRSAGLSRYAVDPDVQIRTAVADAIGLAGDAAALPIVEGMRRDRDMGVALAAERAVARLTALGRA